MYGFLPNTGQPGEDFHIYTEDWWNIFIFPGHQVQDPIPSPSPKGQKDHLFINEEAEVLGLQKKPSSDKEAKEPPALGSEHLKQSVSCEECGHTTQNIGEMKLYVKNKHIISQVDGNTSLVDKKRKQLKKKSLCKYGRLLKRFKSEFKNVKILNQVEKRKGSKEMN